MAEQTGRRYVLAWTTDTRPIPKCAKSARAVIPNHRFLITHEGGLVKLLVSRGDGRGGAVCTLHRSEHHDEAEALAAADAFLDEMEARGGLGFGGLW